MTLKSSEEWNKELCIPRGIIICDPDGWDRQNYQYSWYEEMVDEKEFNKRMCFSTCMFTKGIMTLSD